jgi:hypothetical protein
MSAGYREVRLLCLPEASLPTAIERMAISSGRSHADVILLFLRAM